MRTTRQPETKHWQVKAIGEPPGSLRMPCMMQSQKGRRVMRGVINGIALSVPLWMLILWWLL